MAMTATGAGAESLDKAAIEAPFRLMIDGWNRHDMSVINDAFTPDAEWVNVVGMHWRGRDQILFAHQAFHATIFKTNTQRLESLETRLIAPGVAVVVASITQGAYTTPDGNSMPEALDRLSLTMVKTADGWRIAQGQNTIVNPQAVANDPVLRMPKR